MRTIIAYLQGEKAFFVYGFAKSQRSNITRSELEALKVLAKKLLAYSPAEIADAVRAGELIKLEG
ncbi:MAG: type II toxin-antitoxin system RelE/ParE family toxin [Woeseiaceae bacterium]